MSEAPQSVLGQWLEWADEPDHRYVLPEIREAIRVVAWTDQAPDVADTLKTLMAERDALRRENQDWQDRCLAMQTERDELRDTAPREEE